MRLLAILLPALLLAACAETEKADTGPAPLPAHPVGEVSKGDLPPVHASGDPAARDCQGQNTGCKATN